MKSTRHLAAALIVLAIGAAAAFFLLGKHDTAPDAAFTRLYDALQETEPAL